MRTFLHWLLGKPATAVHPVGNALQRFRQPDADTLELIRNLVAVLRPQNRGDTGFIDRYQAMLDHLEADATLRAAFCGHVVHFVATRRLVTFFTDSGILPGTGFFSEWWRILGNRLLPEAPDERRLKDCLHVIYHRSDDWRWLQEIPSEFSQRFWELIAPDRELRNIDWRSIQEQMLDAVLLLAHRVSGLGVDSELMRASPNFDDDVPRFVALSAEALDFVNAFRAALDDPEQPADDGSQLLVIASQCQETLEKIRKRALTVGTSLHLSYLLTRSGQSIDRLHELVAILGAGLQAATHGAAIRGWGEFAHAAFIAENRRNSLRFYLAQLSGLLAARVTENAARSGEHYICETAGDYSRMWRSAAGAGVVIACMALLKIKAAALHAPLFGEAFLFSMIYGLGFVAIFLGGMTVATKQPAMTAQTLAGLLGDLKLSRSADLERLVDVIAAVCRSQLAAIAGNVMVAFPVAVAVSVGAGLLFGQPPVGADKGARLLADLDPLSWAIPHAAIAGFYLFLSGLITGYFDNRAAYTDIGLRLSRLRWLQALFGKRRAERIGGYIQDRLGGIMGNFLFGCMLGSTGIIGIILGLPLDIRHIAFASANVGYALTAFQFALPAKAIAWAVLGVAAIGLTNLTVSFLLALRTALRARDIQFEHGGRLLRALGRRLLRQPRSFFLPPSPEPRQASADA
ncbi:site-specific recombinase [Dechloromonas sp. XY25]|uniref:Site-specific recombinase n=1 Tax=Dechloromonas hankyongensis TaxID=2908002 RepID=A0ABS9JZF3_9RHOO|nr:preprotein translocase subunit TatB [Dechloromonas hankyongensis]MCG2576290.1 site-specific recombinase [Dechloromonas hankyongensis]